MVVVLVPVVVVLLLVLVVLSCAWGMLVNFSSSARSYLQ
jgi:hypothetical protein